MLKTKKMLSVVIALLLVTTVLVGCGTQSSSGNNTKTTKDMVYDAFLNDVEITTQEFKIDMSIKLNGTNVNDPQFDFISNLLNNSRIILSGKTDTVAKKAEINATINLGGMSFEGKMFIDDKVIALNVPILGMMMNDQRLSTGYIVIDSETLMEEFGQEQVDVFANDDEIVALATRVVEMYLDLLDDNMFVNNGKKDITTGDISVKATEVEIIIGENEFKDVFNNALNMINDPEFGNLLYDLLTLSNEYITREEFDNELRMVLDGIDGNTEEVTNEMLQFIDFDNTNFKINFFINDSSNIVKSLADIRFGVRDHGTTVSFDLLVESDAWNINQPLTVEIPELNETNSIDFYELMFMYIGSLYF